MEIKKCIILGANGYLGKHLSKYLHESGIEVVAFDNTSNKNEGLVNCKIIDLSDESVLNDVDWNVDCVFHFAGLTGTYNGFDNYSGYIKANEILLLNVLTSIRKSQCRPRLVFPSTRLVYKGSEQLLNENATKEAKTIYAANKICCEYFLEAYRNAFNIDYTIFRICVPYGNLLGDSYSYGTIGFFINQARKDGVISLYGDGSLRRTFTHVEDICHQIVFTVRHNLSKNEVYNVAGENFSLKEVAILIAKKFGAKVEFTDWPERDLNIESGHTIFNSQKIESIVPSNVLGKMNKWIEGFN